MTTELAPNPSETVQMAPMVPKQKFPPDLTVAIASFSSVKKALLIIDRGSPEPEVRDKLEGICSIVKTRAVNNALRKYPFENAFMTSHLGVDHELIDLLIERAREVEEKRFEFS
jgi:hypothetical protein